MNKTKLILAVILISSILLIGQPAVKTVTASGIFTDVPAVVFVQDKNNKMLINDGFESDNKLYVSIDHDVDIGFYFTVPTK